MNSPDLTVAMVKMVLSLSLILAILWGVHRWMRRAMPTSRSQMNGRLIKVLGSHHLGMKKSIALVKVPGSVLVVGVGTEQVTLLKSIDDPELINDMDPVDKDIAGMSFRNQLQRFTRNFKGMGEQGPSNEEKGAGQ
jgi:flagellar biosynthetic protein FliO